MNDLEIVQEFLSKKNLDGIDKFLLEKYLKAVRNMFDKFIQNEKMIDEMAYSLADYMMYYDYDKCRVPHMIKHKAEELKEYFRKKVEKDANTNS